MQLLLISAADDVSWSDDLLDTFVGGKAIAGYIIALVGGLVGYLMYRTRGLHVVIDASKQHCRWSRAGTSRS